VLFLDPEVQHEFEDLVFWLQGWIEFVWEGFCMFHCLLVGQAVLLMKSLFSQATYQCLISELVLSLKVVSVKHFDFVFLPESIWLQM